MCRNIVSPYHDEAKKVVESAIFLVNSNEFNFVVILMFFALHNKKKTVYVFMFQNILFITLACYF